MDGRLTGAGLQLDVRQAPLPSMLRAAATPLRHRVPVHRRPSGGGTRLDGFDPVAQVEQHLPHHPNVGKLEQR